MDKVYLVIAQLECEGRFSGVTSAWTTLEQAMAECRRLDEVDKAKGVFREDRWSFAEVPLNQPCDDFIS